MSAWRRSLSSSSIVGTISLNATRAFGYRNKKSRISSSDKSDSMFLPPELIHQFRAIVCLLHKGEAYSDPIEAGMLFVRDESYPLAVREKKNKPPRAERE